MTESLPLLGLLVAPGYPDGVNGFLERMVQWCRPVWREPGTVGPEVHAWFATAPSAPGFDRAVASGAPVAVWIASPDDAALVPDGVVTVGDRMGLPVDVVAPRRGMDVSAIPPLTPFVRRRWRVRHGLPELFVVHSRDVSVANRSTAFALASAVVVDDDSTTLVEAMAWAAPCVTDDECATAVGAEAGVDALVGDPGDRLDLAAVLADDHRRAASVGRSGRRLVERSFDRARAARRLATRLGFGVRADDDWRGRVTDDLAHLGTPPIARIRDRFEAAVAGLVADGAR